MADPLTTSRSLQSVLQRQIESADRRVRNGGNVYQHDSVEVRIAATRVSEIAKSLGLGRFVQNLTPNTGKPQFLLMFESGAINAGGAYKVLKVYGHSSPGEGRLQKHWTELDKPVVQTWTFGDKPTSWLLMEPVNGPTLESDLRQHPEQLLSRTTELAAIMTDLTGTDCPRFANARSLRQAMTPHLKAVIPALMRHGYSVPKRWSRLAEATYAMGNTRILHSDLWGTNICLETDADRVAKTGSSLVLLDSASFRCIGAPEFDAARWIVRNSEPQDFASMRAAWIAGAPQTDLEVLQAMLAIESLMQAGVREIIKDERKLSVKRDAVTQSFLDFFDANREVVHSNVGLLGAASTSVVRPALSL